MSIYKLGVLILVFLATVWSGAAEARQELPDFTLETLDGTFTLSEFRGRVVLLYFAFVSCPECALEAPAIAKINSEYGKHGVITVVVNIWPVYSLQDWKAYWHLVGGGDAVFAQDPNARVFWMLEALSAGATIIIDRDGREVYRDIGATSYETLKSAIEKAL